MRNFYFAIFLSILPCAVFSQVKPATFKFSDTGFTVGATFRARIDIDLDNRNIRDYHIPLFDSVAAFMKEHPELVFAIESYTDQRGSDSNNLDYSQRRASFIKRKLTEKGVSEFNLAAVGMGEGSPVVSQSTIDAEKDKYKKEDLYAKNRRYEFKILYIYKPVFLLTDSVFTIGGTMRPYVLFDFNKATIRPECLPLIDSIAKFLLAHPNLTVEVSNHRDSRGSDMYGSNLTQARARAVTDRLIQQGVPPAQVTYKGYGETKPVVSEAYILSKKSKDAQEQLYQLNRRTEITILKVE